MPDIAVLPDHLVNQIAAGEVVERPASIVKEMVENAIDAGADVIEVTVENGGKKNIIIQDNGSGMNKENLALAIQRHATSKIRSLDDLNNVTTMGFRGEALPAIASVSRFEIVTQEKGTDQGYKLSTTGGETPNITPAAAVDGTRITVEDLFFNTPARRKFLKGDRTELNHIIDAMNRFALVYPQYSFKLNHNGKKIFNLSPTTIESRIQALFNINPEDLLPLEETERGSAMVYGFVTAPHQHFANRNHLYLFVNRRTVKQTSLLQACIQSAKDVLPAGRYPGAFIYIDCQPDTIDVNVHPAKTEVKFEDQSSIYGLIRSICKHAFTDYKQTTGFSENLPQQESAAPSMDAPWSKPVSKDMGEHGEQRSTNEFIQPRPSSLNFDRAPSPSPSHGSTTISGVNETSDSEAFGSIPPSPAAAPTSSELPSLDEIENADVFQLDNTYIVMRYRSGILVLDQHAIHEKVVFLKLRNHAQDKVLSQRLLSPEVISISPKMVNNFDQYQNVFSSAGFEVELFGEAEAACYSVPVCLQHANLTDLLNQVFQSIDPKRDLLEYRDQVIESIACHGSVRAGRRLDPDSMRAVVRDYLTMEETGTCPHGRPVAKFFPLPEIAKWFDR